ADPQVSGRPQGAAPTRCGATADPQVSGRPQGAAPTRCGATADPQVSGRPQGAAPTRCRATADPQRSGRPQGAAPTRCGATADPQVSGRPQGAAPTRCGATADPQVPGRPQGAAPAGCGTHLRIPMSRRSVVPPRSLSPNASDNPPWPSASGTVRYCTSAPATIQLTILASTPPKTTDPANVSLVSSPAIANVDVSRYPMRSTPAP